MGWLRKKSDPINTRAKALSAEIAALQGQIHQLNRRIQDAESQPKLRSTALPSGHVSGAPAPKPAEPIFEPVDHARVQRAEPDTTPEHFNELGLRKYDLLALWRRLRHHLQGPPASNPRLVNYLASGAIQGLRPMRYEKRVARNRLLGLAFLLAAILYGIIYVLLRR